MSLEAEYSETMVVLNQFVDSRAYREAAAIELLETARRPQEELSAEIETWFTQVFLNYRTLNVPSGAVTSYLGSGISDLIQNLRLRELLAAWPNLLEENAENEEWESRLVEGEMRPFLASRTRLGRLYAAHPGRIYGDFSDGELDEHGLRVALADPEFSNLVTTRLAGVRVLQRELNALRTAAAEILSLVRQELN